MRMHIQPASLCRSCIYIYISSCCKYKLYIQDALRAELHIHRDAARLCCKYKLYIQDARAELQLHLCAARMAHELYSQDRRERGIFVLYSQYVSNHNKLIRCELYVIDEAMHFRCAFAEPWRYRQRPLIVSAMCIPKSFFSVCSAIFTFCEIIRHATQEGLEQTANARAAFSTKGKP